jgi:serine/threonine protein kinase
MNEQSPGETTPLGIEQARQINHICRDFERAWDADAPPDLADYLARWIGPDAGPLLKELAAVDLELRQSKGLTADPSSYARRFPQHAVWLAGLSSADQEPGTATSDFAVGQNLGPYRIVREIGRGGMGVVYEAVHDELGRTVALKVLPAAAMWRAEQIARFRREARTGGKLNHPHIVPVYEAGQSGGLHYIAMPYLAGGSLREWVQSRRGGPGPDHVHAARVVLQAALALQHAHEQNVLHRDIKPANLLLDEAGHVWLSDFGLALPLHDTNSLTQTGDVVGTLRYLPPEALRGEWLPASDVFSLGLTLYELVTLQPAFRSNDSWGLFDEIRVCNPAPPRQVDPSVPPPLEEIILHAIAPRPEQRYASAADFAADLQRFLDGEPIRTRRPWPRWPFALAGLLALAACLLVWLWPRQQTEEPPEPPAVKQKPPLLGIIPSPEPLPRGRRWQIDTVALRQPVQKVAWSPDGKSVACGLLNGQVRAYALVDGALRLTRIFPAHRGEVTALAWNGGRIVSGGEDGRVLVWHPDGRLQRELGGKRGPVRALAVGPTGRFVIAPTEDGQPALWDIEGGPTQTIFAHDRTAFSAAAWSPDGALVAVARASGVWIVTPEGAGAAPPIACQGLPASLDWSADSKSLAIAGGGGPVQIWQRDTQKSWDLPYRPDLAVFAGPDRLCLLFDARMEFAPVAGGPTTLIYQPPLRHFTTLAWSDKARMLIQGQQGLNLWSTDGKAGTKVPLDTTLSSLALAWSPDGNTLAAFSKLQLIDDRGRLGKQLCPDVAFEATWSPDSKRVAMTSAFDPTVRIYRLDGGLDAGLDGMGPLAWGQGKGAQLARYDAAKGRMLLHPSGESFEVTRDLGGVFRAAWGPNGLLVAQQKGVGRWDGPKAPFRPLLNFAAPLSPRGLCSRPGGDGEFAIALADGVRVLGPDAVERRKAGPFSAEVHGACWSPDGKWLAVSCRDGQTFFSGQGECAPLPGYGTIVFGLDWSTKGLLAQALPDGVIRVSEPLAEGQRFRWGVVGLESGTYTFGPDGRTISGPKGDKTGLVYLVEDEGGELRLATPAEFARLRDG